MNGPRCVALCVALLAGLAGGSATGADSDIYANRVSPALSQPLVIFSIDARKAQQAVYAGCSLVGAGAAICAPAKYFRDNCPSCVLPAATSAFTYFDAIRLSMRMALLQVSGVQAGLLLNHAQDPSCAGPRPLLPLGSQRCSNGAYVAAAVKPVDQLVNLLTTPASLAPGANLAPFLLKLDNLPAAGTAPYQGKEVFFELFRYLTGQALYNGHNGYTDYGTDNTLNLDADNAAASWDLTAESLGKYVSPLKASLRCSRVYTINFLMDASSSDNDSDEALTAGLAGGGMDGINLSGSNNKFRTVIGWLNTVDLARSPNAFGGVPLLEGTQNVTSYFYTPPTPRNSNPVTFDDSITEYANKGGTTRPLPLGDDPAALVDSLRTLLGQVVSVSTTFLAPSLAANTFNRAETLDNVYLTLFQPDLGLKPFWPGNVKKLKLKAFDAVCAPDMTNCGREAKIVDANGNVAISPDGRIRQDALSFWTDGSMIAADPSNGVIAGRDGRAVTLGGAGSKIPGTTTGTPGLSNSATGARQLYLYPGTGTSLIPLNADLSTAAIAQAPLGVATAALALPLLTYIRGYDYATPTAVRPWLMGDPMHSRPLPINYGALAGYSKSNPAIYIAVSTNDGFLHFIRNTSTGGAENGGEAWAFMPLELLGIQQKLALNAPTPARVFGFDGAPATYVRDLDGDGTVESGDGDRAWLYGGMRRGGRVQYGLDVTDPVTPRFLWRIGNNTPDFAELGYTFSQPRVARVRTSTGSRTAVIFGGGYDLNKDYTGTLLGLFQNSQTSTGSLGTDDSMGNAIYVVDAETGALIWKAVRGTGTGTTNDPRIYTHAGLKDSIPSAPTVVDTDGDGNADRILVGDTGGNIWRADLGGDPGAWTLTLLAQLGRHASGASGKADDRRFFHEPDLVLSRDATGPYDAIVIGSGDREDPLDYGRARSATGVETFTENGFYLIKDRKVAVGSATGVTPLTPAQLTDVSSNCLQAGASGCAPNLAAGWRLRLTQAPGEKVLSSVLTAASRMYFTSYLPPDAHNTTSCTPSEGTGLFYAVGLADGTASFNYNVADGAGSGGGGNSASDRARPLASVGIPSSPVYVNIADPASPGGSVKCVLASDLDCRSGSGPTRFRTFWNRTEH